MANVQPVITDTIPGCVVATWALANGDTGVPVGYGGYVERSVQVSGTFGAGGSVQMEVSNDGVNYTIGGGIVAAALGPQPVSFPALYMRPHCTAGDGTTALVVTLFMAKRAQIV